MADSARSRKSVKRRERRLAEVFGEVLPDTTSDERDGRADEGGSSDRWYRENRPPHHD